MLVMMDYATGLCVLGEADTRGRFDLTQLSLARLARAHAGRPCHSFQMLV